MNDVLVVGAGPAGAVAATLLARAGARVLIVDRAEFPRDKLCGDTVNPGTLSALRRLNMADAVDAGGLRVDGMLITSEGLAVEGRYPPGVYGRALVRRHLDWALLQQALAAGAQFESSVAARRAIVESGAGEPCVSGIVVGVHEAERKLPARVVIAADGRRSTLAFGLALARHPRRPRRWAIGAYFENAAGLTTLGEMHIRRGRYVGVAPLPGGLANVCLVKPSQPADAALHDSEGFLRRELARDPVLADRFSAARLVAPPVVLGPLAVDAVHRSMRGLILAGDAAGFIDPMTGDGLRFAVRGGELAALAARRVLEHGWDGVHEQLEETRRREFARKWMFNRALRALVASSVALRACEAVASIAPSALRAVVRHAGDCRT